MTEGASTKIEVEVKGLDDTGSLREEMAALRAEVAALRAGLGELVALGREMLKEPEGE